MLLRKRYENLILKEIILAIYVIFIIFIVLAVLEMFQKTKLK